MPAYNAAPYIEETVASILKQTYKNIEIILVNDGSTDETEAVISRLKLPNIIALSQPNKGAGAARNYAYVSSKGKYIKFLDADDLLNPEAIERQVELAEKYPDSLISGKWGRFYRSDIHSFKLNEELVWRDMGSKDWIIESWAEGANMTQPGIFLIPRKLIEKAGLWVEDLSKGPCDDMEFFTRIMLATNDIKFCADSTLFYRSGLNESLSGLKENESFEWFYQTIDMATSQLLKKVNTRSAKKAAAVQFKLLLYKAYNHNPEVSKAAAKKVKALGGTNHPYPAGGISKILSKIIGWKLTSKIKYFLNNNQ